MQAYEAIGACGTHCARHNNTATRGLTGDSDFEDLTLLPFYVKLRLCRITG